MRLLFLGDIVGRPGLELVKSALPMLRAEKQIDVVIANAENVSGGSGCLPAAYRQLKAAGVDLMTLGHHVYKKAEIIEVLRNETNICRPANLPEQAPGLGYAMGTFGEVTVAVVSVLGRTPLDEIRRVRLERAKALLRTDVPIYQVAKASGFGTPEYLATSFLRANGSTPTEYRRQFGSGSRAEQLPPSSVL